MIRPDRGVARRSKEPDHAAEHNHDVLTCVQRVGTKVRAGTMGAAARRPALSDVKGDP